jgi:hypothetical protein
MSGYARILLFALAPCLLAGQVMPAYQAACNVKCCGGDGCPVCLARRQGAERDANRGAAKRPGCGKCCQAKGKQTASARRSAAGSCETARLQPLCKCRHGRSGPVLPTPNRSSSRNDDLFPAGVANSSVLLTVSVFGATIGCDRSPRSGTGPPVWIRNCSLLT